MHNSHNYNRSFIHISHNLLTSKPLSNSVSTDSFSVLVPIPDNCLRFKASSYPLQQHAIHRNLIGTSATTRPSSRQLVHMEPVSETIMLHQIWCRRQPNPNRSTHPSTSIRKRANQERSRPRSCWHTNPRRIHLPTPHSTSNSAPKATPTTATTRRSSMMPNGASQTKTPIASIISTDTYLLPHTSPSKHMLITLHTNCWQSERAATPFTS